MTPGGVGRSGQTGLLLALWCASRCLVVVWAATSFGKESATDLNRYALFATGSQEQTANPWLAWEYPTLARGLLSLDFGLDAPAYKVAYFLVIVSIDLGFLLWVMRESARHGSLSAGWMWVVLPPLLGVLAYTRYDLVVGVLASVALVTAGARPKTGAILLSLAAALKLWPVLWLPLLLSRPKSRERRSAAICFVGMWLLIETVGVAILGWRTLTAPWTWQIERGVQVEAVVATAVRYLDPGSEAIDLRFNAWELAAPQWVPIGSMAVGFLSVLIVLTLTVGRVRGLGLEPARSKDRIVLSSAALVIGLVVLFAKTLSPQYLFWLLPVIVLANTRGLYRTLSVPMVLALVCTLTTVVYPIVYPHILDNYPVAWSLLLARNALLVALVILLFHTWRDVVLRGDSLSAQRVSVAP